MLCRCATLVRLSRSISDIRFPARLSTSGIELIGSKIHTSRTDCSCVVRQHYVQNPEFFRYHTKIDCLNRDSADLDCQIVRSSPLTIGDCACVEQIQNAYAPSPDLIVIHVCKINPSEKTTRGAISRYIDTRETTKI